MCSSHLDMCLNTRVLCLMSALLTYTLVEKPPKWNPSPGPHFPLHPPWRNGNQLQLPSIPKAVGQPSGDGPGLMELTPGHEGVGALTSKSSPGSHTGILSSASRPQVIAPWGQSLGLWRALE